MVRRVKKVEEGQERRGEGNGVGEKGEWEEVEGGREQ